MAFHGDEVFLERAPFVELQTDELGYFEMEAFEGESVSAAKVMSRITSCFPEKDAMKQLGVFLRRGLLRGHCHRGYVEWAECKNDKAWENGGDLQDWLSEQPPWFSESRILEKNVKISDHLWNDKLLSKTNDWLDKVDEFSKSYFADWQRGEFRVAEIHARYLKKTDDSEYVEEPSHVGITTFYNVEFLLADLNSIAPLRQEKFHNGRSSKFDWEAAFADVSSWLFHEAEIPDVNANGVQKAIVDELRKSFLNRNLAVPEDTSLKNKARKIMGALRSK